MNNNWFESRGLKVLKYQLLYDWRMNERPAYNAATRNGWLEKCTEHMKNKYHKNL